MAFSWTPHQQKALEPTDKLTVLSAAAGSGKTTVLVERAIRLLLDETNKVSADKMLIVTFSNASAAEFKRRIEKGINEKIIENPQNTYIKAQKIALQKADISTIHSFCIKLTRENFQSLDISPDFTICDEAQGDDLHEKAINAAVSHGYENEDFKTMVSFYGKSSTDKNIKEFLRQMDYFFSALPHPIRSAEKMAEEYSANDILVKSPAYQQLITTVQQSCDYLIYLAERMDEINQRSDFSGYDNGIEEALKTAHEIYAAAKAEDILMIKNISNQKLSLGRVKGKNSDSEAVQEVHKKFKEKLSDIREITEYLDEEKFRSDTEKTDRYVKALFDVFIYYQNELMKIKKEKKMFEFSDFEHFALDLLQKEDGSATDLCISLRNHYRYIMEDEFQDTSYVQDAIFTMIAKENQANLYVVGDLKQSIYGFRKASPQIFLDKRQIGIDDATKGNTLYLPDNFRSSKSVIMGVNHIFRNLMSKLRGGIEYDSTEELVPKPGIDDTVGVEIKLWEGGEPENIAATISNMIKDGYLIKDGDKERPVKSGDFCILMRSKTQFPRYKERLENLGYQAFVRDDELILTKPEVQSIISLLRVVANPLQEVYLTATMFGDIFSFSLDEILRIRADGRNMNLYKALAISKNQKAKDMLSILKDISYVASAYSADKLVDYICKKTGYYQRIAFSEDGRIKRENIRWFIDFSKNYAKTHPSDLSAFIRWIDMYLESGKATNAEGQKNPDAINIMTMHTSKGLEFPVCIVAELTSMFNKRDTSKHLLLDTELGVGMYTNTKFGYNNSTLNVQAIKDKIETTSASEEMRILYVAFTRSKNLLILSGHYNRLFTENTIGRIVSITGNKPHPVQIRDASTPMHWVIAAFAHHKEISDLYTFAKEDKSIENYAEINLQRLAFTEEEQEETQEEVQKISADMEKIKENLSFVYPHMARTALPIKMSVSELAKNSRITLAKPAFINTDKVSATDKGTAMHQFAQFADIAKARENLEAEIERLENDGHIHRELLNETSIEKFIQSPLADRILESDEVFREKDFLVPYNAGKALENETFGNDEIIIQGIMDCIIRKGDEITVIDYKTDHIKTMADLKNRYEKQLELYRYGAKHLFKTENVKCILYSFHLNDFIEF